MVGLHHPQVADLVEVGSGDVGFELDVLAQIVAGSHVIEISEDLRLREVGGIHGPFLQEVLVEGVAVHLSFGI